MESQMMFTGSLCGIGLMFVPGRNGVTRFVAANHVMKKRCSMRQTDVRERQWTSDGKERFLGSVQKKINKTLL